MEIGFHFVRTIDAAVATAATELGWQPADFQPDVKTADPVHGDFQSNGVLPYAKKERRNPREMAQTLVTRLQDLADHFEIGVAGPGFINFTAKPSTLLAWLRRFGTETDLQQAAAERYRNQRYVVDFSSPNTAKQMHVGHLRGMVIGEAICRLLAFCGARVTRDNHIGDWGTQFGKLIWGYRNRLDPEGLKRDPLEELERLYRVADEACKADPAVLEASREELVRLQSGNPDNRALWETINRLSLDALDKIYRRLDIRFDVTLGESFYRDKLDPVYEELTNAGIAEESQGALVVFHPEHPRYAKQPFIIRKSDGASNYASTDLATALYRVDHFAADAIVILTDPRQRDHFEQLFLTVEKWFRATGRRLPRMEHITFGSILGSDGKAIKTRSGDPIKLKDLLDEAEERAFAIVTQKNPGLEEDERRGIAAVVGPGSIRYADLCQNRTSDYVFSWEKLLSFDGNTAPYLLYAVARIHSIFRKHEIDPENVPGEPAGLETPAELKLARKLTAFAPVLELTTESLRPHYLCTYLYELAGEFSAFYTADKVLVDDPGIRARRLLLCSRTLVVLKTGLHLLGLRTLERM